MDDGLGLPSRRGGTIGHASCIATGCQGCYEVRRLNEGEMPRSSGQGVTGRSGGMVRLLGAVLCNRLRASSGRAATIRSVVYEHAGDDRRRGRALSIFDHRTRRGRARYGRDHGQRASRLAHAHGQRQPHGHIDRHAERCKRRPESRHSRRQRRREQRTAELHDHRHCRERSAGLYEHRADGGDARRALHLYRDGHRSRRRHADICRADAAVLAHVLRCDALRHSGSSQRRHAQRHDHGVGWHRGSGRAIVPNRRRERERSAGLHEHRADGSDSRRWPTPTPRRLPIPTATR